jgi:hypothetical protein
VLDDCAASSVEKQRQTLLPALGRLLKGPSGAPLQLLQPENPVCSVPLYLVLLF